MGDGDVFMSGSEGVLDVRTQVERKNHFERSKYISLNVVFDEVKRYTPGSATAVTRRSAVDAGKALKSKAPVVQYGRLVHVIPLWADSKCGLRNILKRFYTCSNTIDIRIGTATIDSVQYQCNIVQARCDYLLTCLVVFVSASWRQ